MLGMPEQCTLMFFFIVANLAFSGSPCRISDGLLSPDVALKVM